MPSCSYCNTPIDEEWNFCTNCERQVKCMHCRGYLLKDRSRCLKCGTLLNVPQHSSVPMNTFVLEEKQSKNYYSKKINLCWTGNEIDKVAPILSNHVSLNIPLNSPHRTVITESTNALPSSEGLNEETGYTQDESIQKKVVENGHQQNDESQNPSSYFEKDGQGCLISKNPDYKGKNRKDQQQRFSLLYVWAYNHLHNEPVPNKTHMNHAAKQNGLYDSNYPNHFNDIANRFFIKSDGTFKLNPAGLAEINKILLEMQDLDHNGFEYWNLNRKTVNKANRTNKEDRQKIEQWIQLPSKLANFDMRNLKPRVNYALFAIYDITKELKLESAIKPSLAYEYLVRRYKTIPIRKSDFSPLFSNKTYSNYFNSTPDGAYYLTPDSENAIENLLNQNHIENL